MTEKLNILLLEDNTHDAEVINRELRNSDFLFSLKVVATKGDFLNALKNYSPGLILADYTLPSYDGLSALLAARETHANVPFIFVSGTIGEEKAIEAMRNGATDYVLKERLSKLSPAVNRAIRETNERKKRLAAEIELSSREKKYRSLFEESNDGIILHKLDGTIFDTNTKIQKMLNYGQDELNGISVKTLHPDSELESSRLAFEQTREDGNVRFETKFIRKDGSLIDVSINSKIIDRKNDLVQGIVRDITERKRTEEALRGSEFKYRCMMESLTDQIYICSPESTVEYMNPVMIKRLGKDATGETCHKVLHGLDHPCDWCVFDKVIKGETIETTIISPLDGHHYRITNMPIQNKNGTVSKMSVYRDITQYLKAVAEKEKSQVQLKQAQKMEAIGTLAGGIAHDFNNILTAIVGFSELILIDVKKGSAVEHDAQEIITASMRARDLIRQVLIFARQSDEERVPMRVDLVAKEVLKLIRSSIPTSIEIRSKIESKSKILGNPTQCHQIFMNLCTNAAYAMESEGGILDVSILDMDIKNNNESIEKWDLSAGEYIKIGIKDTGAGIPENVIKSIFDPYFTTKPFGEGTGMGLSMVHGIVERYGGKIFVDSILEKGTVFTIFIPITKTHNKNVSELEKPLPVGTEHILVVDDEILITKILDRMLNLLGYSVTKRNSSIEALELFKIKPNHFDLVISDMTMPNMTGDKLAIEMIKIRPNIPVILCTGYSKKITDQKALEIGAKALIPKPIINADLARTLRKVLDDAKESGE